VPRRGIFSRASRFFLNATLRLLHASMGRQPFPRFATTYPVLLTAASKATESDQGVTGRRDVAASTKRSASSGRRKRICTSARVAVQVTPVLGGRPELAQGQSAVPGAPWPAFNVATFTRQINYETASLRDDLVRSRAEMPPRGGGTPAMGELRQIW
jgi:hypothetical protein